MDATELRAIAKQIFDKVNDQASLFYNDKTFRLLDLKTTLGIPVRYKKTWENNKWETMIDIGHNPDSPRGEPLLHFLHKDGTCTINNVTSATVHITENEVIVPPHSAPKDYMEHLKNFLEDTLADSQNLSLDNTPIRTLLGGSVLPGGEPNLPKLP